MENEINKAAHEYAEKAASEAGRLENAFKAGAQWAGNGGNITFVPLQQTFSCGEGYTGTATCGRTLPKDGVYFLTESNDAIPYTDTPPSNAKGILVVQGERNIVVALKDSPEVKETKLTARTDPDDCQGNYIQAYIDVVDDWSGKENTEHLKAVGLSPNIHLEDGQYIPSMGEMLFIFTHRKAVNEALEKINAQPIGGDWYWTSTENGVTYAWYLCLVNGSMYYATKDTNARRVRPVSTFIP